MNGYIRISKITFSHIRQFFHGLLYIKKAFKVYQKVNKQMIIDHSHDNHAKLIMTDLKAH